eukprot:5953120-Amphidinium_carterae.1
MLTEVVGVPSWAANDGICWRCKCTKATVREVGLAASWRSQPVSHTDLLLSLQAKDRLSKVFDLPGFEASCIKIDWLHVVDIGIAANFYGSVLHFALSLRGYGPNQAIRAQALFRLMLAFYQESG